MRSQGFQPIKKEMSGKYRLALVCVTLMVVGCGGETPENERVVYPATGLVTYRGKPIPDASVVLHPVVPPADDKPFYMPRGVVGKDGTFQITTYRKGDGAPPGEYQVTVSWQGPLEGVDEDDEDRLPERLPRKYKNPQTSRISVTIVEGTNELEEMKLN